MKLQDLVHLDVPTSSLNEKFIGSTYHNTTEVGLSYPFSGIRELEILLPGG